MAATTAGFLELHPEFGSAGSTLLDAHLAEGEALISGLSEADWEYAVYAYMAYRLSAHPNARALRKQPPGSRNTDSGESDYEIHWLRWREALGVGGFAI